MRNVGRDSKISNTASTGTAKTSRSIPSVTNCASWLTAVLVMSSDPFEFGIARVGAAGGHVEGEATATVGAGLGLERRLCGGYFIGVGVPIALRCRLGGGFPRCDMGDR